MANEPQPLWNERDQQLLMDADQYWEFLEHKGEVLAEVGSEYFLELRDASDANCLAQRYFDVAMERRWGMSQWEIDQLYFELYGTEVSRG